MKGSIEWRRKPKNGKPGYYRLRVYAGRNEFGKKKYIDQFGTGFQEDADRALRTLLKKLDDGEPVAPAKETIGAYLKRWMKDYKRPLLLAGKFSPTTYAGYESIIKTHVEPMIGHIRLDKLVTNPKPLQAYFRTKLESGLSPTTVAHHASLLHSAFEIARKRERLIAHNPVDFTEPPEPKSKKGKVWTREQVLHFLKVAEPPTDPEEQKTHHRYFALFHLALVTGMRLGELLGLKWDRVQLDMTVPYIDVDQSHFEITGERGYKDPKSETSVRPLVLDERTLQVLRDHKNRQDREKEVVGEKYTDEGRVFATLEGKAPYRSNLRTNHFLKLVDRAKLPRIRIHDLRHTHITLLREAGVPMKSAQEQAGHSTITLTMERYTHGISGERAKTAKALARHLWGDEAAGPEEKPKRLRLVT